MICFEILINLCVYDHRGHGESHLDAIDQMIFELVGVGRPLQLIAAFAFVSLTHLAHQQMPRRKMSWWVNTLNHDVLQQKLDLYGIHDEEPKWFCSYLTKRKQYCKVNGKLSNIESISCGVPQGSCLGPLLFIIYINDLHLHIKHSDVNMYADDTNLRYASEYTEVINDSVNEGLYNLKSWIQANKLFLDVAKTKCLIIDSRKRLKDRR